MGKVKNILIVSDRGTITGGVAKIAFTEMLALKQRGYNVTFFCGAGPVSPEVEQNGIKAYCLNQKGILTETRVVGFYRGIWNVKARRTLFGILSGFDPNDTVVHIHGWTKCMSASILDVGDKMGFKTFVTLHDFFLYCPNGGLLIYNKNQICDFKPMSVKCFACNCDSRSVLHKYWRYVRQIVQDAVIRKCSNVTFISISKLSNDIFLKFRPDWSKRLHRIDNPIDISTKCSNSGTSSQTGDKYLFVGRLSEEKGIRLFLEAVTQAGVKAEVWGDGYLMEELKSKYPDVLFRGWVKDNQKMEYLKDIKALVFPSVLYETFGLVVAEMLSLGIPCIVGDRTAASELVKDGQSGFLYKIGNLSSLKEAIGKMEKCRESLNPQAYFDTEKYSVQFHIDKLVKLYNDSL